MARKPRSPNPAATGLFQRIKSLAGPKDRVELLEMLRTAQGQGLLDADGLAMLEGALQVSDLQVRDIMVPRNQMIAVRRDDAAMRIVQTVVDSGHSRFPVLEAESDDICGILLAKDLLRLMLGGPAEKLQIDKLIRKAVFVPESKRVNLLLKELRLSRNHLAMVVDEYGGVAGLVTIEDVIEQIVGEIDDEFDVADESNIRGEGERQFSVRGATTVEEFNEFFNADFNDEDATTIAGVVVQQFGRLPRRGESIVIGGYEFRVMRADRRRIEGLRVTTPLPPMDESEAPPADVGARDAAAASDRGVA
ncbi:MAG: transporter associated domain-containing protein [Steroidobacteraceae bacterium]